MSVPKDSNSLRYFLAGFKPLGRPMFWLPMGFLSLLLISYWQYQQNPNWLRANPGQPRLSLEDEVPPEGFPQTVDEVEPGPSPDEEQPAPRAARSPRDNQGGASGETDETAASDPLAPFTGNTRGNSSRSSLFLPLLPKVTPNSSLSTGRSLAPLQVPPAESDNNYPLQKALDAPNPPAPANPSPVPPATTYQPYGTGQGAAPVPTADPGRGTAPIDGNPNAPTATGNRNYSIQPTVNLRAPGY